MDTESLQARVLEAYDHGPEAVTELVATLLSEVASQVAALRARVALGSTVTLRHRPCHHPTG